MVTTSMMPRSFARPPPSLPGLGAEELGDPGPPLVREGLAVDQDQRGCLVRGDDRAGGHGLARPWRRDKHRQYWPIR
jgi:hypothetical protein